MTAGRRIPPPRPARGAGRRIPPPRPACGADGRGPVGVIAGRGLLPVEIAQGARREGRAVVCLNVFDADASLARIADAYHTIPLGKLGAIVATLRTHGVREIVLAGKVDKLAAAASVQLDALGMQVAGRLTDFGDASILAGLVVALEESGFIVAPQVRYAGHLVAAAGVLGRHAPSPAHEADIALGVRVARQCAGLDIGQAVAVRRGMVIAVEAAEGTDAMIARAGALAAGAVVVKVGRPTQDPRYDLPAVGPRTAAALADARGAALAVEAGRTLLLKRDRLMARADEAGIAVVAVECPTIVPSEDPGPPRIRISPANSWGGAGGRPAASSGRDR